MILKVSLGVLFLVLAGLYHRYWYVATRKQRFRPDHELNDGKVRDANDFFLKWRWTVAFLALGWVFLAAARWTG